MAIPRNLANIAPHVNASSTELVVNDGGANLDFRVEGDTNANLLVADAGAEKVGFGTNTFNTNGGVIQVSNGISFPATQSACADANSLDDYEEGTWTPSIGGDATYSARSGNYTKVGDWVFFEFSISIATKGTGSVNTISGLPFTARAGGSGGVGPTAYCAYWVDLAVSIIHLSFGRAGATSIIAYGNTSAGTQLNSAAIFGNSAVVIGQGAYLI